MFASAVVVIGGVFDSVVQASLDTTRVTDAGSTRTVVIVSGVLVLVAFALIGVTVWFWRNTVPDPDALESLAFFEERVVDAADDGDAIQQRRISRSEDGDARRTGMHMPHRNRADRTVEGDRTESVERSRRDRRRHGTD